MYFQEDCGNKLQETIPVGKDSNRPGLVNYDRLYYGSLLDALAQALQQVIGGQALGGVLPAGPGGVKVS